MGTKRTGAYKQWKMGHQGHMRFLLVVFSGEVRHVVLKQIQVNLYIFISKTMVKYCIRFLDSWRAPSGSVFDRNRQGFRTIKISFYLHWKERLILHRSL